MFEIGKEYFGFNLTKETWIEDVQSKSRVFEHKKSGAKVLWLENDDDNKVFSITFKTPPYDNKGAAHIVEHSVLHGSRKYRTKAPYMDMMNGSLNTFLNAVTYNDKTVYPVASRNENDLMNLMDVYLDSVFFPRMMEEENIIKQEGFRLHLEGNDQDIQGKGVVYNEMVGSFSNPRTILARGINESLYPNGTYRFSSGGVPKNIREVKTQDVRAFYQRYYHPSNCYIYLYGNMDGLKFLDRISAEYLSFFEKKSIQSESVMQKEDLKTHEHEIKYGIEKAEEGLEKDFLSRNYLINTDQSTEEFIALKVLNHILVDSPNSIIKRAFKKDGFGENSMILDGDGPQPSLSIVAQNVSSNRKKEFEVLIDETLDKAVKEGLDKQLVQSCINMVEYNFREAGGFPTKGIMFNLMCMDTWIYCEDECRYLSYSECIKSIKEKSLEGYFEKMIKDKLIQNNNRSLIILKGDSEINKEKEESLIDELNSIREKMTSDEIDKLVYETVGFNQWQIREESQAEKETIPKLEIEDVSMKSETIEQEEINVDGIKILNHEVFSQDISYIDYWFDIGHVAMEDVPYAALLRDILGTTETDKFSAKELVDLMLCKTGGINNSLYAYVDSKDTDRYYPKFKVSSKIIGEDMEDLFSVLNEIFNNSKLENRDKVKEVIFNNKAGLEINIFKRALNVLSKRMSMAYSDAAIFTEKSGGFMYYWFLLDIVQDYENKIEEVMRKLRDVYDKLFCLDNLIISFTGENKNFRIFMENFLKSLEGLEVNKLDRCCTNTIAKDRYVSEGIVMGSDIQFVGMGYNIKNLGYEYSGKLRVLESIINKEYLHKRVREQGGAYGCIATFSKGGNVTFISYRDPNMKDTINIYEGIPEFLEKLNIEDRELEQFKIGAIGKLEGAETPRMKGEIATAYYVSGISQQDLQREREEILQTDIEDIRNMASMMKNYVKNANTCVLGNYIKVLEHRELFTSLITFIGTEV